MSTEPLTNDEYWAHVHDARANALFKTQGALLVALEYLQGGDLVSAENSLKTAISYGEGLPFGVLTVGQPSSTAAGSEPPPIPSKTLRVSGTNPPVC